MLRLRLLLFAAAFLAISCGPSFEPYDLRCEGLEEPLAIGSTVPHFSWKIRSRQPMTQRAYEIEVGPGLWSSGKIVSHDQVMVPYEGLPLRSRVQAWWRVRVWKSDKEVSRWSAPQRFGVGILPPDTLKGSYIGAVPGEGRSPFLRKTFSLDSVPQQALLHVNSLGYHEVRINGKKVSDDVLAPAVSQLDRRALTVSYDITGWLHKGDNELLLCLGRGWYRPSTFGTVYDGPLVKAELDVYGQGQTEALLWTDSSWEGAWSGYRDLGTWTPHRFGGEEIDARVEPAWGPVDVVTAAYITASPQVCEPTRVQEVLLPEHIESAGPGSWLLDFGRIVNAMMDVSLPQLPAGHVATATFSDFLRADGTLEEATQGVDRYISSGKPDGDRFEDRFNHHAFRYLRLDGLDQEPELGAVRARRIRTDYPAKSSFRCSDPELNRIHDLVAWTLENLSFGGYMVDCATIERLGYGGDGNASTQSLQILGDVASLYLNWLTAWADAQRPDGGLPHTAPNPYTAGGGPYWCSFLVQAAWRTYISYGDDRPIRAFYPAMKHWLDYVDAHTQDGLLHRWPNTDYRGWYLGDWAAPNGVDVQDPASIDLVNNCALCQVYPDLEKMASLLGEEADAASFRQRYAALSTRIHETFYHPEDATYASGSQLDMVYPLLVGAVPDSLQQRVRETLLHRTENVYESHLATGLVGMPVITEWATLERQCDWMYGMLKQHGYPGYLYMLDQGATGVWEEWDGGRSHLHNCYNGIFSWFYQALGGIIPEEPGYRKVRIDPQVPAGLDWVEVTQETPYGPIVVHRKGKRLHVELPVGITATVVEQD